MKEIITRKIKVVTNAGGMNPEGLKNVIEQLTRVPSQVHCLPKLVSGSGIACTSSRRGCG